MEIRVPELDQCLDLEPSHADEQTEDDTGAVLLSAGLFGSLDNLLGDNSAVGLCNETLLQLAADDLLD